MTQRRHRTIEISKSKIALIIAFLILISNIVYSQKYIQLKGQILDKESNIGIPNVNIYLQSRIFGTSSNNQGFFSFNIPTDTSNDTIIFSALGYENAKLSIHKFSEGRNLNIFLTPKPFTLINIDILGKNLDPKSLIKKTRDSVRINYYTNPVILNCYRKSFVTYGNNAFMSTEYALELQFDDITNQWDTYGRMHITSKRADSWSKKVNSYKMFDYSSELYWAVDAYSKKRNRFYYFTDTVFYLGNDLIYVISSIPKNINAIYLEGMLDDIELEDSIMLHNVELSKVTYYIDVTNMVLLKMEKRFKSDCTSKFEICEFQKIDNLYYPKRITVYRKGRDAISAVPEIEGTRFYFDDLQVNEIITDTVQINVERPKFSNQESWEKVILKNEFDPEIELWENYNSVTNDSLFEVIRQYNKK